MNGAVEYERCGQTNGKSSAYDQSSVESTNTKTTSTKNTRSSSSTTELHKDMSTTVQNSTRPRATMDIDFANHNKKRTGKPFTKEEWLVIKAIYEEEVKKNGKCSGKYLSFKAQIGEKSALKAIIYFKLGQLPPNYAGTINTGVSKKLIHEIDGDTNHSKLSPGKPHKYKYVQPFTEERWLQVKSTYDELLKQNGQCSIKYLSIKAQISMNSAAKAISFFKRGEIPPYNSSNHITKEKWASVFSTYDKLMTETGECFGEQVAYLVNVSEYSARKAIRLHEEGTTWGCSDDLIEAYNEWNTKRSALCKKNDTKMRKKKKLSPCHKKGLFTKEKWTFIFSTYDEITQHLGQCTTGQLAKAANIGNETARRAIRLYENGQNLGITEECIEACNEFKAKQKQDQICSEKQSSIESVVKTNTISKTSECSSQSNIDHHHDKDEKLPKDKTSCDEQPLVEPVAKAETISKTTTCSTITIKSHMEEKSQENADDQFYLLLGIVSREQDDPIRLS